MKIGWIGLGNMGIPMSQRLLDAGFDVTLYNRTAEKLESFRSKGVKTVSTPKALIKTVDVVFIMVSDDHALREVCYGENGLLQDSLNDKIMVNMSTVSPAISREIAKTCHEKSGAYLDAPVSGSVKPAQEGTLVIMVGGEVAVFEKVKPLLAHLGRLSVYVGEAGMGNTAKLAANLFLGIITQGLAEATLFALQHGIRMEDLFEIFNHAAIASPYIKMKSEALEQNQFNAAFALRHLAKDLRLAKEEGMNLPLGRVAYETYQQALQTTLADLDSIAVYQFLNQVNQDATSNNADQQGN
ncbi:MAG: NAD(P)-dependent oxidoreductase [Microbacter sp.]